LKISLILGCKINWISNEGSNELKRKSGNVLSWQRKHYDWPDLPKGFQSTISGPYAIPVGEKGKFRKPLANAIYGAFKQFNTLDLNSLKMDGRYLTGGIFFFKKRRVIARQNKILRRYIYRGHYLEPGSYGQIMNSEELASIWHFPTLVVKAPLVKTTEAKRSQPPMSLPIEQTSLPPASAGSPPAAPRAEPPQNLPT